MPDVYSGWTISITDLEGWRNSPHCPDKLKNRPYTPGDVSALHALVERFIADLGVNDYVFPELILRPVKPGSTKREPGERTIIFARRHDEDTQPLDENDFDKSVKTFLTRAGFGNLSVWQNIIWDDDGVSFI